MKRIILNTDGTFRHWHTSQPLSEVVEVSNAVALELSQNPQTKKLDGGAAIDIVLTQSELDRNRAGEERSWRNAELRGVDIEILKAEDSSIDTTPLRAYRQALRDYPQQGDFPEGARPVA